MDWMTAEELVAYLKISRATMNRMMRRGLPHVRVGRILRFDKHEVDGWLMTHRDTPTKTTKARTGGRKR